MFFHALSFLCPLPLALILCQEFQDYFLHLRRGVILGKEFPHLIGAEADFLSLVWLGLGENGEDTVCVQLSRVAQLLHLDCLG